MKKVIHKFLGLIVPICILGCFGDDEEEEETDNMQMGKKKRRERKQRRQSNETKVSNNNVTDDTWGDINDLDGLLRKFLALSNDHPQDKQELISEIKDKIQVKDGQVLWTKNDDQEVVLFDANKDDKRKFIKNAIECYKKGFCFDLGWDDNALGMDFSNLNWVEDWFGGLKDNEAEILKLKDKVVLVNDKQEQEVLYGDIDCKFGLGKKVSAALNIKQGLREENGCITYGKLFTALVTLARKGVLDPKKLGIKFSYVPKSDDANYRIKCSSLNCEIESESLMDGNQSDFFKYLFPKLVISKVVFLGDDNQKNQFKVTFDKSEEAFLGNFEGILNFSDDSVGVSVLLPFLVEQKNFFNCKIQNDSVTINGQVLNTHNGNKETILRQIAYLKYCGALSLTEDYVFTLSYVPQNKFFTISSTFTGDNKEYSLETIMILAKAGMLSFDGKEITAGTPVELTEGKLKIGDKEFEINQV